MPMTSIDTVTPDMEVSSDVTDANGNILLKKGTLLSDVWIERLKRRGVLSVDVSEHAVEADGSASEGQSENSKNLPYDNLQDHMKLIFSPVLSQPHMKALARATYQHMKAKE